MVQRNLKGVLAGIALVALLMGASPADAATRPGLAGFWNWLAGSLGERIAVLERGAGHAQGHGSRGSARQLEKQGGCIDPNGCAHYQSTGSASPVCLALSDQGPCVDPNG
jgi:hypothetical protein